LLAVIPLFPECLRRATVATPAIYLIHIDAGDIAVIGINTTDCHNDSHPPLFNRRLSMNNTMQPSSNGLEYRSKDCLVLAESCSSYWLN